MESLCKTCKFADIATKDRTIIKRGMRVKQSAGGTICTLSKVENITITDGIMTCSNYEERVKK